MNKRMLPFTVWPGLMLLVVACAAPTPASTASAQEAAATLTLELGKPFSLRPGESAQTPDGSWRLGFEGVSADSRCPKGQQCVWAGDASARVWLRKTAGTKQTHELHTATGTTQAALPPDHALQLLRLDPAPVSGKALTQAGYVLTLVWIRRTESVPER
jgi:hypothetical protein